MAIKKKILVVLGTRPEAIKMAPIIKKLIFNKKYNVRVCLTSQHKQMLQQVISLFGIKPYYDLNLMIQGQVLIDLSAKIMYGVTNIINKWKPNLVLVHGDTTTSAFASVACFYENIAVGHVEAGLRTGNLRSPYPEEFNRKVNGIIARLHFAPTLESRRNLINEGVAKNWIKVTGNTVIDALKLINHKIEGKAKNKELRKRFSFLNASKKLLLVTGHRRENFGRGFDNLISALNSLSQRQDLEIIYPVHYNPNVKDIVYQKLSNCKNIFLIQPQDYMNFVYLMKRCDLILTDSGGIQEEAPTFNKHVFLMRNTTERPEAVKSGIVKVIGMDAKKIVREVTNYICGNHASKRIKNPYGDGESAGVICDFIDEYFQNL